MLTLPSPSTIPVNALISCWRDSEKGRYGLATILTPDAPADLAFFATNEHATEPELNVSFECSIDLVRGRWRVVKMACDLPPQVLDISGTVVELLDSPGLPAWKVELNFENGERRFAQLGSKSLNAVNLAWVDNGTLVRVQVELPAKGEGRIQSLLAPTAALVLAADADHPASGYLAVPRRTWDIADQEQPKALPFALQLNSTGAWLLLWVKPSELRKQGIRAVSCVSLSEPFVVDCANSALVAASAILQSGMPEELENLVLSVIRVELRFDARRDAWTLARLRAPLSLREPKEEGEAVHWVQAQICAINPDKQPDQREGNDATSAEKVQTERPWRIWMSIDDYRLGRGQVSGFLTPQIVNQASLEEGVQVVVTLMSRESYWNVKQLHRSTPKREDV